MAFRNCPRKIATGWPRWNEVPRTDMQAQHPPNLPYHYTWLLCYSTTLDFVWGSTEPSLCACGITCIKLFSPCLLARISPGQEGGGRPTYLTHPGSSDPRGCCITNIASPLFVYFLPNPPGRPSAQQGWGKHRRKTDFTKGKTSYLRGIS